ncbi:citrin [Maudiozyma humilis]|uniref:Mitochondrial aspartate-glutamate transporter AGC1 n=1 Tax=Maudiozyma humilis TaxID=51915 RepID=A0AAV5RSN9_MAUHU|nr:citrin [Kazachstania humilis]
MEQVNSNSKKKIQQLDIFKRYARVSSAASGSSSGSGELVLDYDKFIQLITDSQRLYSQFTDHSFNLNRVPANTFGCIFFAIDEHNKGYLTINDWFYFNNILECDNYNLILLYEFLRKFDVGRITAAAARDSPTALQDKRAQSINYSDRFLSFDSLQLNVGQLKQTIKLLQDSVQDPFAKKHGIVLDWETLKCLRLYETFPFGGFSSIDRAYYNDPALNKATENKDAYISLNSLVTGLQNELKGEKLRIGFHSLAQLDARKQCLTINRNQLVYLLKTFYAHKVSAELFDSLNFSNSNRIKWSNQSVSYGVFKDIFYLFQNFDLLNQVLVKHASAHGLSVDELREHVITKDTLVDLLHSQYNKVNNITQFSPAQIDLLFSIVSNSKQLDKAKNLVNQHALAPNANASTTAASASDSSASASARVHTDAEINDFIMTDYAHGTNNQRKRNLELFNVSYNSLSDEFYQDSAPYFNMPTHKKSLFQQIFGKNDVNDNGLVSGDALTLEDFMKIINPNYLNDLVHALELNSTKNKSLYVNNYFFPIFDSIYNFGLGSIAGCIGATMVYPIDFIKTRMQAQRSNAKYKNSIDCLTKVVKSEGITGLYSGLGFQLIGVAPEKAIKLTVNDFMRNKLVDGQNRLSVPSEILSGASAGMCQVIFTNPIEIVKIRLQVKSEYAASADITAVKIIRSLGITGLYKGVAACLMRDVPFSAIYFPTYAHLKKDLFQFDPQDKTKRNRLKTWELLLAGAIAGMPAAFLTTPFDVVKTRLQIEPKQGETRYKGIFHAFRTILKEESYRSFFKGGGARVLRSSPQFGFTLAAYELFKNIFPVPNFAGANGSNPGAAPGGPSGPGGGLGSAMDSLTTLSQEANHNLKSRNGTSAELFGPTVDPYSMNYLNYYSKSCEVAKTFIDLDTNFSRFDRSVYTKFHDRLDSITRGE